MSFDKTYLAVNSPSLGRLPANFPTAAVMTSPLMPMVGYPGQPMFFAALPQPAPPSMTSLIDKNNPPPRRTGFCKFFNVGKGFGFIKDSRPEELPTLKGDPGTDIFVHYSCIVSCEAPYKSLLDGEPVEYYLGRSNKGLAALEITGPGGASVKGCMNSRSPTVLQPMPAFTGPGIVASTLTGPSPGTSPVASPAFDYSTFQNSAAWSLPMASAKAIPMHSNSPTFSLAVGMPVGVNQHLRRETTESLGVPNYGAAAKMYRMSSTPVSAPGFGSSHMKEFRDSASIASLGVGIGIGVHWEPKPRAKTPQWSPPGGTVATLKEVLHANTSFNAGRRAGEAFVDRTKSNWRVEEIKTRSTSLDLSSDSSTQAVSV
ncbi:hypothetical protein O181_002391 [Austropuccinia psidii MF-1]|uniref:CSD domain-containing protein n=1 Tax=Austropuccinia psidii MF-1 TaxID=1389203 RepID=A0A9Q3BBU6_9BASI|nr:hypothetical protein [Austropuccinia psidii MF-1]